MDKKRIIFHIDVNNAYLSWTAVDLLQKGYKKDIRCIPSIIGGDESKRRGIVLAKSPVAKKMGIITAETIYTARKKCPNLQIFPPDFKLYQKNSKLLIDYLSNFTPNIEQFSIDECFLDMSGTSFLYDDLIKLAYKIKNEIKSMFGFTVNIGIAENKLCAKMASDFEKPDKVHTLFSTEIAEKMWPLPVGELFMVGKKSTILLNQLGIKTIGDLANADINKLRKHFKSQADGLISAANGIDYSKVEVNSSKNKCISISETLSYDMSDPVLLKKILLRQAEEIGHELRKQKVYTTTIAVTFKTDDFISYSHQMKLTNSTNTTTSIYKTACILFDKGWRKEPIRNIGIRLSDFVNDKITQVSLFETDKDKTDDLIQEAIDNIKDKFGKNSILPASLLSKKEKSTNNM